MNSLKSSRSSSRRASTTIAMPLLSLLVFLSGCSSSTQEQIESGYGRQRGQQYSQSVNGTTAFIDLFEKKGHNVTTWSKLSPRLEKYDTIVWAPDNFDPPSQPEIDKLNKWLSSDRNRTLIYVGRDFDAEVAYWTAVLPMATANEKSEMLRRKAAAETRHASERAMSSRSAKCEWFELDSTAASRQVTSLQGDWASQVNASKVDIKINTTMTPLLDQRAVYTRMKQRDLLSSNGDAIVTEITDAVIWPNNKLILVTNGSFLLNICMVNKENRILASELIRECQPRGEVVFLESGPNGIPVVDNERDEHSGKAGQWASIWPLNIMLFHFLMIGIVFLFVYLPTFGRPRKIEEESTADFGKHVESLGALIRSTGDQKYALSRIEHYQKHVKRDPKTKHT